MGNNKKAVWLLEKRNLVASKAFKYFRLLNKKEIAPCKVIRNPESGIQVILVSGIQNPPIMESKIQNGIWNPESMDVESGIHGCGIRNPQHGIRNPGLSWITLHGAKGELKQ